MFMSEKEDIPETIEDKLADLQDEIRVLSEDLAYLHEYITEFYLSVDMKMRELESKLKNKPESPS
jgi:hypothetical protein